MSQFVVTDLEKDQALERQAMLAIRGGYSASAIPVSAPFLTLLSRFRAHRALGAIFGVDTFASASGVNNANVQVVQLNIAIDSPNAVQNNSNLVLQF